MSTPTKSQKSNHASTLLMKRKNENLIAKNLNRGIIFINIY